MTTMKRYRSHKIVEAAPIVSVTLPTESDQADPTAMVKTAIENGEQQVCFLRPSQTGAWPQVGDYVVRYQPDGYTSWSPRAVFEAGYTEIEA